MTSETLWLSAFAGIGVTVPLVLMGHLLYRLGVRHGLGLRSSRLERIRRSLSLHQTDWSLGIGEAHPQSGGDFQGAVKFTQVENRIRFEGTDPQGGRWSGEGLCFGNHLSCVYLARVGDRHEFGTMMLEADDRIQVLHGTRTIGSTRSQGIRVVPICLRYGLGFTNRRGFNGSHEQEKTSPSVTSCGPDATFRVESPRGFSGKLIVRPMPAGPEESGTQTVVSQGAK